MISYRQRHQAEAQSLVHLTLTLVSFRRLFVKSSHFAALFKKRHIVL